LLDIISLPPTAPEHFAADAITPFATPPPRFAAADFRDIFAADAAAAVYAAAFHAAEIIPLPLDYFDADARLRAAIFAFIILPFRLIAAIFAADID
jgi:hypothetical protein